MAEYDTAAMGLFLVGFLHLAQGWVACPLLLCSGDFEANQCAKRSNSQVVVVNQNGCNDNFACSFLSLLNWTESNSSESLPCSPSSDLYFNNTWPCPPRTPLKDLAEGAHPKQCVSSLDCVLQDNSTAMCVCTPSAAQRTGLCRPDKNEALFADYWSECELKGQVEDRDWALFFYLWQQYSVLYITEEKPECAVTVLYEFQQLEKVKKDIVGAYELAAVFVFALILGLI